MADEPTPNTPAQPNDRLGLTRPTSRLWSRLPLAVDWLDRPPKEELPKIVLPPSAPRKD